mgnify:CR=1 FL=1
MFGEEYVEIKLIGDTFDDCAVAAKIFTEKNGMTFIPPFDDRQDHRRAGNCRVRNL